MPNVSLFIYRSSLKRTWKPGSFPLARSLICPAVKVCLPVCTVNSLASVGLFIMHKVKSWVRFARFGPSEATGRFKMRYFKMYWEFSVLCECPLLHQTNLLVITNPLELDSVHPHFGNYKVSAWIKLGCLAFYSFILNYYITFNTVYRIEN